MPKIYSLLLLFISSTCFAQNDTTILVINVAPEFIVLNKRMKQVAERNGISLDSVKSQIRSESLAQIKAVFAAPNYTVLEASPQFSELSNNMTFSKEGNGIVPSIIFDQPETEPPFFFNYNGPQNYASRDLDSLSTANFCDVMHQNHVDYVLFINKFEVRTEIPLSKKMIFHWHIDVYDSELNKVIGDKSLTRLSITKTMYYDVFVHKHKQALAGIHRKIRARIAKGLHAHEN